MGPVIMTEVEVASVAAGGRAAAGVVIRAPDGTPLAVLGRVETAGSRQGAVYRGVLAGLLRARRLGARAVRVLLDSPEVHAQLSGGADIPPDLIGPYLQARALFNAYRRREVRCLDGGSSALALEAARRALASCGEDTDEDDEALPLWRAASG